MRPTVAELHERTYAGKSPGGCLTRVESRRNAEIARGCALRCSGVFLRDPTVRRAPRRARGKMQGCQGRRGPRPSEDKLRIDGIALQWPSRMVPIDSTLLGGVLMGVARGG